MSLPGGAQHANRGGGGDFTGVSTREEMVDGEKLFFPLSKVGHVAKRCGFA